MVPAAEAASARRPAALGPPERHPVAPESLLALAPAALPPLALDPLALGPLRLDPGAPLALLAAPLLPFPLEPLRERAPTGTESIQLGHRRRPSAWLGSGRRRRLGGRVAPENRLREWLGLDRGGRCSSASRPGHGPRGSARLPASIELLPPQQLALAALSLLTRAPPRLALGATLVIARGLPRIERCCPELRIELVVAGRPPQVTGLDPGIE